MERGTFIATLFGKGEQPSLTLPHPLHVIRRVVPDQALRRDGWLVPLCQDHLDRHGDLALQLVRATGAPLALVYSPRATVEQARPVPADEPPPCPVTLLE